MSLFSLGEARRAVPAPSSASNPAAAAEMRACEELMRKGSVSFHAASLLLPRAVREPATALYAFCRVADDAVDLSPDPEAALAMLRLRLDLVYAGGAREPVDRALAGVVRRFDIPREALEALFEGFAWDSGRRLYRTQSDLVAYGVRVAGTVGVMMALIMGARSQEALARACDLGIAMQLTNIARDVGEDARNGRLYLPRAWMRDAGLDPEAWLAAPVFDHRMMTVVARLLQLADLYYERAAPGIAALPAGCRPAIRAARLVYREIGRAVARQGYDSVTRRAYVPTGRKFALLAQACLPAGSDEPVFRREPPAPEALFLLRAVRARLGDAPAPPVKPALARWRLTPFRTRALAALNILERAALRDLERGVGR